MVLRSEDVRANPTGLIRAYWHAMGLKDAPHAFEWQAKMPEDWQQVAGWHDSVAASGAIRPLTEADRQALQDRFARAAAKAPYLQALLDHHRPFYENFGAVALAAAD